KEMNIERVTYLALAAVFSAASCTKEAAEPDVYDWETGEIYFKPSISDAAYSRAQDMTLGRLESFQVTCFNMPDRKKDPAGYIAPYFGNAMFMRSGSAVGGTFISSPDEESYSWPSNEGLIRFFAFSPSLESMATGNTVNEDDDSGRYFNLINRTTDTQSGLSISYRLGTMRINPDISRQFDFITAETSGEREKDFKGGVDLAFKHQLCQIELRAWGANSVLKYEIAGVRIGNPVVEGEFIFADDSDPASAGRWTFPDSPVKGKAEYIYNSNATSPSGQEPQSGDRIFIINKLEHNAQESAESIMGSGGNAMVLPTVNKKWEGLADPKIDSTPYSTDRMYISVLMRITNNYDNRMVVYPYPGNPDGMNVVYYAVDNSGRIVTRLYPGENTDEYITDQGLRYEQKPNETIKEFGWAAIPIEANWEAGKRYIYTINYSEGAGWRDPEDPQPGENILNNDVHIDFEIAGWKEGTSTDVSVPRK
ncbi:MAG: fimbrillin family protein, partial [Muribaculaceae bacterium]|nr:fimbrillin family protein [Muribaculaceae bacterium]